MRSELDPVTFELVHASLLSAAEEMGGVLKRSSYSPIIREMDDFSCALFSAAGDLVAQADYIPAQLGAMSLVTKSIIHQWGDMIAPGDAYLCNHPYMGAMHTPDLNVIMPVFIEGRLFAWAGTTAHHIDVGGVNPGTEGPDLTQIYAEGLLLPPVRLYQRGDENPDVFRVFTANVRDSLSAVSDLRAQRAACLLGHKRLEEAVERFGLAVIERGFAQALNVVERATRSILSELPNGEGEAEGYLDDDGVGGPPVRIHAKLMKRADHLTVDLSGTAGQIPGALNVPWASTRAVVVFLLRAMTDPAMTTNDGVLRPVEIICPLGTILNPYPPAAVSVRHNTCQRLADVVIRAASALWPDRAVGSSTVAFFGFNLESVSPRTGRESVMMDVVGGGTGAHHTDDGLDGVDTYMSNVGLLPAEVAEGEFQIRLLRTELLPGSQGLGEHNGGLGLRREYLILDRPQTATIYAEQTNPRFSPTGARGGSAAGPTTITILAPNGEVIELPSKFTRALEPGTIVRIDTSGGGGYGDPHQRDPTHIKADLLDGRLPTEHALDHRGGRREP